MSERAAATKGRLEPKKNPVRAPSPDKSISSPAPDTPVLDTPIQNFSPQQILHLQRTVGNKAVNDLIRRQNAGDGTATVQRSPAAEIKLQTSGKVIQPLFGFGKKKAAATPAATPASTPATASAAPTSAAPAAKETPKTILPAQIDSDVKASAEQKASPVAALNAYRVATGHHLEEAKRHKFKIDRYKTFIEADFVNVKSNAPILIQEEASLSKREKAAGTNKKELKKLAAERTKLDERKRKINEPLESVVGDAQVRLKKAYNAKAIADTELPVVEYAYDELVKTSDANTKGVKHGMLFGSGAHQARRDHYQKKLDMAILIGNSPNPMVSQKEKNTNLRDIPKYERLVKKHQKRMDFVAKAEKDLVKAETLRGQAKLSEGYMSFKRKELKTAKAEIKATSRNVQLKDYLKSKVSTGIKGFVVSTATLGIVELEQGKTDGGYTNKREVVTMLDTWKKDWTALKRVWVARPYGKMTALHLVFQGLGSLILKPLRKMFGAASLIFTGLSLLPIPGLAVVTAPLAAFCTLVTLGLAAAKVALDALLATWSSLTLALNNNAHNTDMLRGQAAGQATDVLTGAVAVGGGFAAPAIGNLAGGDYLNPIQSMHSGSSVMGLSGGTAGGPQGLSQDMVMHQLGVQGAKVPTTIAATVGERAASAALEMGNTSGTRALFQGRQEVATEHAQTPAENYAESRDSKLTKTILNPFKSSDESRRAAKQYHGAVAAGKEASAMQAAASASPEVTGKVSGVDRELQKERLVKRANIRFMKDQAKSKSEALLSALGEPQAKGEEVAAAAKTVESGVASAGAAQGVQPADAPNAAAAQSNVSAAKEAIQEIREIISEAPAAVDEAMAPAPTAA